MVIFLQWEGIRGVLLFSLPQKKNQKFLLGKNILFYFLVGITQVRPDFPGLHPQTLYFIAIRSCNCNVLLSEFKMLIRWLLGFIRLNYNLLLEWDFSPVWATVLSLGYTDYVNNTCTCTPSIKYNVLCFLQGCFVKFLSSISQNYRITEYCSWRLPFAVK